jgi:hypothetical protein
VRSTASRSLGIHVEAARDDHVLAPVEQHQEAVLVEAAEVAGADVATALSVTPLGRGRCLGTAVVAVIMPGEAADDLADLAARQLAPVLVDHADVVSRRRATGRCAACRAARGTRARTCRRLRSCRRTRSGRRASVRGSRSSAPQQTARWC